MTGASLVGDVDVGDEFSGDGGAGEVDLEPAVT